MEKYKLIIVGRTEEVPIITQMTIDALVADMLAFHGYKPTKYTDDFVEALLLKQEGINAIILPKVLTAELKVITFRLHTNIIGLRNTMNLLEGYVVDANGLTVSVKDFGIKDVRDKISTGDAEGMNGALSFLLINIDNNIAALLLTDYTADNRDALEAMKIAIFNDNLAQVAKERERSDLVMNNLDLINDFLKDIKAIWADGKRLFRINNKSKLGDYTNTDIIRRIRRDELHTLIKGNVYNSNGELSSGAKIVARPSTEGKRGKTIQCKSSSKFEFKGLRPINYILTVTLRNGNIFATNVDAVTNQVVILDLHEPAID